MGADLGNEFNQSKNGSRLTTDMVLDDATVTKIEALVKEIMTPRVNMTHVHIDASLEEIVSIIREKKKSRFPVVADKLDNVEGIILAKDVLNYWGRGDFNIKEILRPPFFIPETMRILELLKANGQDKVKVFLGGIIPDEDIPVLQEMGVLGVYGPGTITDDIVRDVMGSVSVSPTP